MARPKKPKYEYVDRLGLYRKRIKDADGKYVAVYDKDPDVLTEKIKQAQDEIKIGLASKKNPTIDVWVEHWVNQKETTHEITSKTAKDYRYVIKRCISPLLGSRKVRDVTKSDLEAALSSVSNLSSSVYNKAVLILKSSFEDAIDNDLISKSPARKLSRGGKKAKEKMALTEEETQILIDAVKDTSAYLPVLLMLRLGLRREELAGLAWDCVYLEEKTPYIAVKRAVRWEHNHPFVSEELKSKASYRNIPVLDSELLSALLSVKEKNGYVIGHVDSPVTQSQFESIWRIVNRRKTGTSYYYKDKKKIEVKRELGKKSTRSKVIYTIYFPVTPHILRHTYITNLFLSGVDIKHVQYLAGHSDPQMTLKVYIHIVENSPSAIAKRLKAAMKIGDEQELQNAGS